MFIQKTDLSVSLYPEVRDMLARYSDVVISEDCQTAESEMEGYLAQRYDIRPELEKTGDARHKFLMQLCVSIAIWNLYQRAETIPNKVVKRYDDAIKSLRDMAKGLIVMPGVASAPQPEPGTPNGDQIGHGSRVPRAALFQ